MRSSLMGTGASLDCRLRCVCWNRLPPHRALHGLGRARQVLADALAWVSLLDINVYRHPPHGTTHPLQDSRQMERSTGKEYDVLFCFFI